MLKKMIKVRVHSFQIIDDAACFWKSNFQSGQQLIVLTTIVTVRGVRIYPFDNKVRKTNLATIQYGIKGYN